jgi:hypothetical protein
MDDAFTPHYLNDAVRQFPKLNALAERAAAQLFAIINTAAKGRSPEHTRA